MGRIFQNHFLSSLFLLVLFPFDCSILYVGKIGRVRGSARGMIIHGLVGTLWGNLPLGGVRFSRGIVNERAGFSGE